jgi:hypothetical protein
MPNRSGSVYGLTLICPIKNEEHLEISHNLAIRKYLRLLPADNTSPFAKVSSTHIARLFVLDDVVYFGMPSCEEHLASRYLVFESNFDGDLEAYLTRLAREVPAEIEAVWQHCEGYPGVQDVTAFIAYMKVCQITTTFYFADVNNKTVQQTLCALQTQSAVAAFIEQNQGKPPQDLQKSFLEFTARLRSAAPPEPGIGQVKELTDKVA